MSLQIDDNVKAQIRERCDIVDLINSYVPLKKFGHNYKACCPFHKEKTPSFNVNQENQYFYCFGCGEKGDAISFVQKFDNLDFVNAIKLLADRYSILIPEGDYGSNNSNQNSAPAADITQLYKLHELAAEYFFSNLKSSEIATQYLHERKITQEEIEEFQLGYAKDEWEGLLNLAKNKNFSDQVLIASGLFIVKEDNGRMYDRFRDRIMFPICNDEGKVIAFSGRVLKAKDKTGKYVNSPETPLFHKSRILYGMHKARRNFTEHGYVLLCEGQLDVIACHSAGLNNAVSAQGTAFTEEHARKLKRHTDKIVLAFDADDAGEKAAIRSLDSLIEVGLTPEVVSLGKGEDPDSLFRNQGADVLKNKIDNSIDFFEHLLNSQISKIGLNTPADRVTVGKVLTAEISKLPDSLTRSTYCQMVADRLRVNVKDLTQQIAYILKKNRPYSSVRPEISEPMMVENLNAERIGKTEIILLELSLISRNIAGYLAEELPVEMLGDNVIFQALNHVLSLGIAGEWDDAGRSVAEKFSDRGGEVLAKIIMNPEFTKATAEKVIKKSLKDCLNDLKRSSLQEKINSILYAMRAPQNDEQLLQLQNNFTDLKKELNELRQI